MISFEGFRPVDGVPIYLQIMNYIKRGCVAGTIVKGDVLPSRRYLSALLGINPMTVQKAFKMLEDEGLITTLQGSGSVIIADDESINRIKLELLEGEIRKMTEYFKQMNISQQKAIELLEEDWEDADNE